MLSYSSKRVFNYSAKSYKIVFNILLLIVALLFSGILATMLCFDKLTNQFDNALVSQYHAYYLNKEQKALLQLQSGNTETIKNSLSNAFYEFKKGDRVYPFKRNLLLKLAEESYNKQQFKSLLYWSAIWFEDDSRDVTAMISYYTALFHTAGKEQEALQILRKIKIDFPKNKLIQNLNILR